MDVQDLRATVLAERIQHVLDTKIYCAVAESFSAEIAELLVFANIPDHSVSAA